jgi:hypothetical protein
MHAAPESTMPDKRRSGSEVRLDGLRKQIFGAQ